MPTSGRSADRSPDFGRLAAVYDAIYAWKDYPDEARTIRRLVRRYGPPPARTLLDVACGTGQHLESLSGSFDAMGLDVSESMLSVARGRLPRVPFAVGSMVDFDLGRRFDVITCLFSAIGYVRSPAALRSTLRCFARHLTPGGVAIVEPWLTPAEARPGAPRLDIAGTKERPIVRMTYVRVTGVRSRLDMHVLAASPDGIDRWVERHEMGLFSPSVMRSAFTGAGLRVHHLTTSLTGQRGLYVGVAPGVRAHRGRPLRSTGSGR